MTKTPLLPENKSQETTKRYHGKTSITQRLLTDLGPLVGVRRKIEKVNVTSREKTRQFRENWSQQLDHKQVPKQGRKQVVSN